MESKGILPEKLRFFYELLTDVEKSENLKKWVLEFSCFILKLQDFI